MRLPGLILVLTLLSAQPLAASEPPSDAAGMEFFEKHIRPLLVAHCYKCHSGEKPKAGLRLDSRAGLLSGGDTGPAIVPGEPDSSLLIEAVRYDPAGYQMPPTGKLDDASIAALTKWIRIGAPWPEAQGVSATASKNGIDLPKRARHWSFQPIRAVSPPDVSRSRWPRSPVDRFILARLEAAGLEPAPTADRRTLLRRVTYDLIGLPPTPEEIENFLQDDSPDAFARVVERLLASPHYGERWGRHWLDLVRFAETGGHEFDYEIPYAWVYRDYVTRSLNADLPYNQFVIEHVAGDLLPVPRRDPVDGTNQSVIGTAFYWFGQFKHSPVDLRAEECDTVDNQLDVFGKTFLGLTIACARCHDHKFDPITTRDYYALAGFLQSSRQQLAAIDSLEPVRTTIENLNDLREAHREVVVNWTAERLDRLVESLFLGEVTNAADRLPPRIRDEITKNPAHPLHPWLILGGLTDSADFNARRKKLLARLSQSVTRAADAGQQADFDQWLPAGFAFDMRPSRQGELIFGESADRPVQRILSDGQWHSGRISGRLHGFLRSPTFTIEQPYIDYFVARQGGPEKPKRPLKSGQIHLIVDGFHAIKDPLYGDLTINVPQSDAPQWLRQDVSRFLGRRAYIEIEDTDDGSLLIEQIRFSSGELPLPPPNRLVLDMLADAESTSATRLADGYRRLFHASEEAWRAGRWQQTKNAADHIELLNVLLALNELVPNDARPSEEWSEFFVRQRELEARIPPPRYSLAMCDGTGEDEHVLIRGNPNKPGEAVPRRFLEVFAGTDPIHPSAGSGRLELARKLVDGSNPLVARVLVNRLWQHHFGRGLVPTPDDFGHMGQPPSHPELLDYLASEFMRTGWSIKAMHRLMLLSSTYQMSSRTTDSRANEVDPQNVLLHRMNVRRLEGEIIRDAMLRLSGRLDRRMYGPSVMPYLTPFMEGRGRPSQSGPLDGDGRRSLYISVRRNFLTPMFLAFDFPTPFTTMGRRSVSNVPAQALALMNNEFVVQQSRLWAERSAGESSTDQRIEQLYAGAFGRPPMPGELQSARQFVVDGSAEAWADLCHVLLNVKEFVFVP